MVLDRPREDPRRLVWLLAWTPLALAFWATTVAHWAKAAMGPPGSNLTSGLALAGLALGFALIVLMLVAGTGELYVRLPRDFWPIPAPSRALVAGVALAILVVALGIGSGTTSGDGGWLGIWGVLKRPELDLRPPGLALIVIAGAYLVPHLVHR